MKNYSHVVDYVQRQPWAMHPTALAAMCEILAARMSGEAFDPEKAEFETNHGGTPYFAEAFAAVSPQNASAVARKDGRVAVLPIRGTILSRLRGLSAFSGGTGLEELQKAFIGLRDDASVKAIVLDIDSPGGSVALLTETTKLIRDSREAKPVIAQVNPMAASAAYGLASAASEIAVTPSGDLGSIGVFAMHVDTSAALEAAGVKVTYIRSQPYKAEGNPHEPMSEEALAYVQSDVNAFDAMLYDDVAAGRGMKASEIRSEFGKGRMVLAAEAVKRGMADRVATLEQTLNRFGASLYGSAGRRAEMPAGTPARTRARHFLRTVDLPRD